MVAVVIAPVFTAVIIATWLTIGVGSPSNGVLMLPIAFFDVGIGVGCLQHPTRWTWLSSLLENHGKLSTRGDENRGESQRVGDLSTRVAVSCR